jgi:methionine-rich copper-binding protein CopC
LINGASATQFWIDLGGLTGTVVAVDGHPVRPVRGTRLPLAMAQRLDVLIDLPGNGAYPIFAQVEGKQARTGIVLVASGAPVPAEIKLNFSEAVIAKFSGVEIKNENGKAIPAGVAVTHPKDRKQLVVPLPAPLTAGRYTVTWHAVSEDTHRVKGEYSFGVDH